MRPRVGVSECLLGRQVRWDGGHRRNDALIDLVGPLVEWVPVCPEVEVGMTVPREPLRLIGDPPRMVAQGGRDWTDAMTAWAARRIDELEALRLHGYVLKSRSPSCGLDGGLFAAALRRRLPDLPLVEETSLADEARRAAFIAAVLAHARR